MREKKNKEKETINITVRGIGGTVYSAFSGEARKRNVPVGTLVTQALGEFLQREGAAIIIENRPEVEISNNDLRSARKPIYFRQINHLIFKDDVVWSTFSGAVAEIKGVSNISIPKSLSSFQVLTKCKGVGKINAR